MLKVRVFKDIIGDNLFFLDVFGFLMIDVMFLVVLLYFFVLLLF